MDRATFIRPIALCVFRKGDRILVREAYDSVRRFTFCRPLGGGIEPGEYSHETVAREIREELGVEVENLTRLDTLECQFVYEGHPYQEIIFVYDGSFTDRSLYGLECIEGYEEDIDAKIVARWRSLDAFDGVNMILFPEGLLDLLKERYESR